MKDFELRRGAVRVKAAAVKPLLLFYTPFPLAIRLPGGKGEKNEKLTLFIRFGVHAAEAGRKPMGAMGLRWK
ncbi:MAG: hypothetical protein IJB22_05825 [Clostridia bacterium]|nr:hypothetical protein [Clostridia bacterium]